MLLILFVISAHSDILSLYFDVLKISVHILQVLKLDVLVFIRKQSVFPLFLRNVLFGNSASPGACN